MDNNITNDRTCLNFVSTNLLVDTLSKVDV